MTTEQKESKNTFDYFSFHKEVAKELYLAALSSPDFKLENLEATTSLCIKLANNLVDNLKNNTKTFGY